jgi:hypothetical protein
MIAIYSLCASLVGTVVTIASSHRGMSPRDAVACGVVAGIWWPLVVVRELARAHGVAYRALRKPESTALGQLGGGGGDV